MSTLKRYHCSECHNEWDGYCPICDNCSEIGYELPVGDWLVNGKMCSLDDVLEEIEGSDDESNVPI